MDKITYIESMYINFAMSKILWSRSVTQTVTKVHTKGQLISECPFDVLNFPKKTTKKFDKFLPKNLKSGLINTIKALSYSIIH